MEFTTRKDWLEARKNGLSGSGASAIMGLNPYMTNAEYWELKTGRRTEPDISDKPYVKYGLAAEGPLIQLFALDYPEYEVRHKDFDLRTHPEKPFLLGSLDGELTERKTGRKGVLEIKTTSILQSMQKEKWNDSVPDNYFYQTMHYMMVTGYDFCILKAQLKRVYKDEDGNDDVKLETRHYYYERHQVRDLLAELEAREDEFWHRNVLADVRPPLLLHI